MKRTALIALPALIALNGCLSFGGKPPKTLLTLTSASPLSAGTSRTAGPGNTVTILTPTVPAAIATTRIPVYDGATTLSYVKDAAWNEPPARLFQRILSETVTARTEKLVLDPRQFSADPGLRLSGQLQKFGIDPAQMQAVVVFDAQISRRPGMVEQRRFEARVPVGVITSDSVGAPLNQAVNDVAAQVADWIK